VRLNPYPKIPLDVPALVRQLTDLFRDIGTNAAVNSEPNIYRGSQAVRFKLLTDAASIETDGSASNHFLVTLGGNRTLANPANLEDGVILNWWVKQDGTGGRTLAYGSKFKWPAGTTPTVTAGASKLDLIVGQYNASLDIIACAITQDIR
jgi:hypothetical protein